MKELPNFTGLWRLMLGESRFGFLAPPALREDSIQHQGNDLRIRTRQRDANGDITVDRNLIIGGGPVEVMIHGRVRLIRADWDGEALVIQTRSEVSGSMRLIEDRLQIPAERDQLLIERLHQQPGGAVRQHLVFARIDVFAGRDAPARR